LKTFHPAKGANPPAFVPADAVKFSRVRLDGKQAWVELQKDGRRDFAAGTAA